jgi:hypothetical protein
MSSSLSLGKGPFSSFLPTNSICTVSSFSLDGFLYVADDVREGGAEAKEAEEGGSQPKKAATPRRWHKGRQRKVPSLPRSFPKFLAFSAALSYSQ